MGRESSDFRIYTEKIRILLRIELNHPHKMNLGSLLDLCAWWGFHLIRIDTSKPTQYIEVSWKDFKKIWQHNPQKGYIEVPAGTEDYIASVEVAELRIKN